MTLMEKLAKAKEDLEATKKAVEAGEKKAEDLQAAITAVKDGFSTIFDSDASFGDKMAAGIAMVTSVMGAYNAVLAASTALSKADRLAKLGAAIG